MLRSSLLCTVAAIVCTTFVHAQVTLTPLPGFGTGGWIAPGSSPYVTIGNTERGLAYNPVTGNLLLVARQNVSGISNNVRIMSSTTGADIAGLDNTGVTGGTFLLNMVDVDESGAIYAANLSGSATAVFKVYKWNDETLAVPPTVAYTALSGLARTGDSFAVTGGSMANPAKFAASGSNAVNASNFAVGTLDGVNSTFTYLSVPGTTAANNDYRLSLTFVDSDTLIGNQGTTARLTSFDPFTSTLDASIPLGGVARRPLDYAVVAGRPLLAVIDTNSSQVTVLDITNPAVPVQLAQANNTTGVLTANGNGAGSVCWGLIAGNTATLYAMSTNQGIQAFQLTLPAATAVPYGTGCDGLVLGTTGVPSIGNLGFELVASNVSVVSPVAFFLIGTVVVPPPGIDLGSIDMVGCALYHNNDIGIYGQAPSISGTATFPLPIPNDLTFLGFTVSSQGLAFSLATGLNLVTSNAVLLTAAF